jgi:hypothetical protein
LLDASSNYSVRQYGDTNMFARIEFNPNKLYGRACVDPHDEWQFRVRILASIIRIGDKLYRDFVSIDVESEHAARWAVKEAVDRYVAEGRGTHHISYVTSAPNEILRAVAINELFSPCSAVTVYNTSRYIFY